MSRRLGLLALGLYPLAFRRRYGEEMRALLNDSSPGVRGVADLLRGALVAHVRAPSSVAGAVAPDDQVRASASAVLACWVAFAAAGLGFYKTTEDAPFASSGNAHVLLGGTHLMVQVLALLGSAAVLLGLTPLVLAALARARRDPALRRMVATPLVALALMVLVSVALIVWVHAQAPVHPSGRARAALVLWLTTGLVCAAVIVVGARRALFATAVQRIWLIVAMVCAAAATAAMLVIALAIATYAVALPLDAHGLAVSANGPVAGVSTAASLVAQALVMIFAAALASITAWRGLRAARQLGSPAPSR